MLPKRRELVQRETAVGTVWLPGRQQMEPHSPSAEDEYLTDTRSVTEVLADAGLTEKQRFVMNLRYGLRDGRKYTIQEIADFMGIRHQSVSQHIRLAKRKLEGVLFE